MRAEVPAAAASGSSRSGRPCARAWSVHASSSRSRICGCGRRPIAALFHVTIATSTVGRMRVVFVHGACVKDGSWWWHRMAPLLQEQKIASVTPELPSCVGAGGLPEDVAAVRAVLTEPSIVVAHSYGGIVAAEA